MSEDPVERGEVPFPAGTLRWWRHGPLGDRPLFLFSHGAGAPASSEWMQAVSIGLAQRGVTVVRFDFPYMTRAALEGRRRPPDRADVLLDACRAMLEAQRSAAPRDTKIVVGGKSMGGRMWSMLLAREPATGVHGALYLGYPLHPPGKPENLRAEHLASVPVPQLFLSGSRDSLARLEILQEVLRGVSGARLSVVEGGDHSLAVKRAQPLAGSDAWLDTAAGFVADVTS